MSYFFKFFVNILRTPTIMKKILTLTFLLFTSLGFSQILNPVQWELGVEQQSKTEFTLVFTANIDTYWAIYALEVEEGGPLPTLFTFENNPAFQLTGEIEDSELNKVTKHDPVFDMVVSKFFDKAEFRQRIEVSEVAFTLSGNIDYMTCDDTKCTYKPDNPFSFNYTPEKGFIVAENSAIQGRDISKNSNEILYGISPEQISKSTTPCSLQSDSISQNLTQQNTLWRIFGLGFLGGLLALLTPCVFPMIPLTVSFFTKKAENSTSKSGLSKAILYGVFIVLVYLILSIPFHLLDSVNPDILNEISTNVWLNVIFFVIFIFFAFSFFGYYELTLPSSWTSATSKGAGVG